MPAVQFESVTKQYPNAPRPAVEGVSLDVAAGQFVVLLGPSGCGKTTLLKMVNRLIEPTAGRIRVEGEDIEGASVTDLRRRIGYVIQNVGLFPHFTVARNVAVVPRLLGWPDGRVNARVDELLELVGLPPAEYCDRYPAQLSGGQQQRVGLARALAADPHLLLMDEPFGAIDAITRARLQGELLALQRQLRKTILFVTHDVEEALRLADRIVVMRAGRVAQYDTPFHLLTRPADDFVSDLVGADDTLRQLSQVRVATVMTAVHGAPPPAPLVDSAAVGPDTDLRAVLSLLLGSGADSVTVVDSGRVVGTVTLDNVRARASASDAAANPSSRRP